MSKSKDLFFIYIHSTQQGILRIYFKILLQKYSCSIIEKVWEIFLLVSIDLFFRILPDA